MTAPPAGELEACLALLEKATPGSWHAMIRGDYGTGNEADVNGSDGNEVEGAEFTEAGNVPTIRGQMRDADARAIVAAVNLLRTHGPALLAALRLREWCEGLVKEWRSQNGADLPAGHFLIGGKEHNARWALDKCADDLARVLESEQ